LTLWAETVRALNTPQFADPGKELPDTSLGFIRNALNEGRTFRAAMVPGR
jgi:hypothetical protein